MPIFSKVVSDNRICDMIDRGYKKVLLLACGGCMNESLAFANSLPLRLNEERAMFPPIEAECLRITNMLCGDGFTVDAIILPSGSNARCIRNLNEEQFALPDGLSPDIILVLSCPSGFRGLSTLIKDIPIYNITEQVGMLYYKYEDDGKERKIVSGKISKFSTIG